MDLAGFERKGPTTPRKPATLRGELWGMTAYFNPVGYANKIDNIELFCDHVRSQGLKLLIIEAAFEGQEFAIDDHSADLVLRVRPSDILWHKERLLNIGLNALPNTCDKVAWLDADVLFENANWATETSRLLQEFVVVQPYDVAWWLPPGLRRPITGWLEDGFVAISHGVAYGQAHPDMCLSPNSHSGFAWACRREVLTKHQFYDRFILGGGDTAICWGMYGQSLRLPVPDWIDWACSPAQVQDLLDWKDPFFADVQGSVSFVSGRCFHLWHGCREDREYSERQLILKAANFDPRSDIALDSALCWRWNSDKPDMHRRVKEYFRRRKEESSSKPE